MESMNSQNHSHLKISPKISDAELESEVQSLQESIQKWITNQDQDLWFDCGFHTYAEHTDRQPSSPPVVTILYMGGDLSQALEDDYDGISTKFGELLDKKGFEYEQVGRGYIHIYPKQNNPMFQPFVEYEYWQWVCGLVKEDIGDVYQELYSYFAKHPETMHRLNWRQFEILIFRIFQNQGFECELGSGSNDGGVDIRLLERDPLGDIITFVQVKKYAEKNKIALGPVQALHGVTNTDNAQKSIFITTSEYLPSTRKFAARTPIPMLLKTSKDVKEWCGRASAVVIDDKSKLIEPSALSKLIQDLSSRDSRIVHANCGYTMIMNKFAIILKETKYAALLMSIPTKKISGDEYTQVGDEVPDIGLNCLSRLHKDYVFRAKRLKDDNYWDGSNLFTAWNGQSVHFNHYD